MRSRTRVAKELAQFFERNGYVRRQNRKRLQALGARYKKGDEVRLVARSKTELRVIRRLLREANFKPGRPFAKGRQFRQPLYGKEAVARFINLIRHPRRK